MHLYPLLISLQDKLPTMFSGYDSNKVIPEKELKIFDFDKLIFCYQKHSWLISLNYGYYHKSNIIFNKDRYTVRVFKHEGRCINIFESNLEISLDYNFIDRLKQKDLLEVILSDAQDLRRKCFDEINEYLK